MKRVAEGVDEWLATRRRKQRVGKEGTYQGRRELGGGVCAGGEISGGCEKDAGVRATSGAERGG